MDATEPLRCPRCGKAGTVTWAESRTGQHRVMIGLSAGFVCVTRQYKDMHIECKACRVPVQRAADVPAGPAPVVLFVDDDATCRLWAKQTLRAAGFKVVIASGYYQALETIAGAGAVDVLVTDVRFLDGLDGLEIARRAKRYKPALAVVYITAYDAPASRDLLGALLQKPISDERLVAAVRAALATRNASSVAGE